MAGIADTVQKQRRFFRTGKTLSLPARQAVLMRLEAAVRRRQEEICRALYEDLGKSETEAYMTEIYGVLAELRRMRRGLARWSRPRRVPGSLAQFPSYGELRPEPYGVVLVMAPWNYPLLLSLQPLAGAVAAGNCVVLKPSAYAPAVSQVLEKLVAEAAPPGYLTVVPGGREANRELLEQEFDYIFFTGGSRVGRLVMEKASAHLTPVTLELGGKSPCLVDRSARLRLAAKRIVFGKFLNCGQTCVAPDYVLVEEAVREEFCGYLLDWIRRFYGEKPLDNPDYPRMVNRKHWERVRGLLEGADILTGGQCREETLQIAPTVVRAGEDSPLMQEEIFGPVLPVLSFRTLAEAEAILRRREKPLALYLFTEDPAVRRRILRRISFGGGCVNDTVLHLTSPWLPFGGVGGSGMGHYHGKYSFDTFSHQKGVACVSSRVDIPLRYPPYTAGKKKRIAALLR